MLSKFVESVKKGWKYAASIVPVVGLMVFGVNSAHATTTLAPLELATAVDGHVTAWITAFQPLLEKYIGYALALAGVSFLMYIIYRFILARR